MTSTALDWRVLLLLGVAAASLVALALLPPIPQDQSYHQFADTRTLFGIPNFWNVVSNLPFIAVGAAGLWSCRDDPVAFVVFLGIFLTGFGSSYYHWLPNDQTLFWDRLPMAFAFTAILAAGIEDRVNARAGRLLLWPLVALGVLSLLVWRWTGDLRLYGWAQYFPCLALPLMFLLFKPRHTGSHFWIVAAAAYAVAKLCEFQDRAIYAAGELLSGHMLKHLMAAYGCYAVLRYFQIRRPIPQALVPSPA
jgi:hypothetical protein